MGFQKVTCNKWVGLRLIIIRGRYRFKEIKCCRI